MFEIVESATFKRWIRGLRDRSAVARINARLRNVSLGNTGDATQVGGGLFEMRVHHGPGYRLYYLREGSTLVLLCGGDKGSQQRDIERAGRPGRGLEADMTEKFTRWDVTEYLRTREDARLYLEACAEEDPGDGSLIRTALNDIARAGNMSRLAREIGMSREGLYKALSEDGNPTFATVMRITRALGLRWRITETPSARTL